MEDKSLQGTLNRVRSLAHKETEHLKGKMDNYSAWSQMYDYDMDTLQYSADVHGSSALLDAIDVDLKLTKSCSVVDFAAGSGRVAKNLRKNGFTGRIVAVDGCEALLQKAKALYKHTYCYILEATAKLPAELTSSRYDAAIMCGAMSPTQVEVDCLHLLINSVSVGGLMVFTTRTNQTNLDYNKRLEEFLNVMTSSGTLSIVFKRYVDEFELAASAEDITEESKYTGGIVYCYKKCNEIEDNLISL